MKSLRRCVPAFALGLTLALAGAAFAQNATQSGSEKKASCCCGDSCEMMKKDGMKNHAGVSDKESCCCCGDSCEMAKKDGMKNHAGVSDKESCCCCGDSCKMKDGTHHTATAASSDKHECCCGDSCNMKDMKDMKSKP